jgi:thiol-disulfide isomerase/thioredoxin
MTETEASPRSSRTWWIVALVCVSAWFLYLYFLGPRGPGSAPVLEGTALSRPAAYDWMLRDLDGTPVSFAQYRGKTVFLNIWATWCPPCVAELPSITQLARTPALKDVAFVCVSIDDDAAAVRRFVNGKDWPMTVLHLGSAELPAVFTTRGIPATFLIAPDGQVAASVVGSADWDDPSVVSFLSDLRGAGTHREEPAPPRPSPADEPR